MMPIAFIAASLRAALHDVEDAWTENDSACFWAARNQAMALIDELERHDDAKERMQAND